MPKSPEQPRPPLAPIRLAKALGRGALRRSGSRRSLRRSRQRWAGALRRPARTRTPLKRPFASAAPSTVQRPSASAHGQPTEPGQTSTVLHVPARYQGRLPLYVGVNAGLIATYGTPVVSATITFYAHSSGKEWEGYYSPTRGPAFSQAYLLVNPAPFGKLRFRAQVGAFSEFFGGPGQWGWGLFGPLLATRGYGESMNVEYDLSPDARLALGHGVAGVPSVPEAFVRGTYTGWNETGVSTVFQHAHVGINYQNKFIARFHFASVYGADERRYLSLVQPPNLPDGSMPAAVDTAHDGRMNVFIAETHWFADQFGQIGLSGGLWDLSHATPIQDGVWWGLNFTQGAQDSNAREDHAQIRTIAVEGLGVPKPTGAIASSVFLRASPFALIGRLSITSS